MPITELIFPSFKQDPESIAVLEKEAPKMFQTFKGIPGLSAGFCAPIVKEDGSSVDLSITKFILVLGWEDVSYFHKFYPESEGFHNFINMVKPLVTAPATPELYRATDRVSDCASSNFVQIVKVKHTKETEGAWQNLLLAVKKFAGEEIIDHTAVGTESQEGAFVGFIGWKSLEAHDQAEKDSTVRDRLGELVQGGPIKSLVVQMNRI